jgi:hypothetical protein
MRGKRQGARPPVHSRPAGKMRRPSPSDAAALAASPSSLREGRQSASEPSCVYNCSSGFPKTHRGRVRRLLSVPGSSSSSCRRFSRSRCTFPPGRQPNRSASDLSYYVCMVRFLVPRSSREVHSRILHAMIGTFPSVAAYYTVNTLIHTEKICEHGRLVSKYSSRSPRLPVQQQQGLGNDDDHDDGVVATPP